MFHICVERFDVTGTVVKILGTKRVLAVFGYISRFYCSTFDQKFRVANEVLLQNHFHNLLCKSREESNEAFDRVIRGWYCSITVANH